MSIVICTMGTKEALELAGLSVELSIQGSVDTFEWIDDGRTAHSGAGWRQESQEHYPDAVLSIWRESSYRLGTVGTDGDGVRLHEGMEGQW